MINTREGERYRSIYSLQFSSEIKCTRNARCKSSELAVVALSLASSGSVFSLRSALSVLVLVLVLLSVSFLFYGFSVLGCRVWNFWPFRLLCSFSVD